MKLRMLRAEDLPAVIRLEEDSFTAEEQLTDMVLATFVESYHATSVAMEADGLLAGHLLACPAESDRLDDRLYQAPHQIPGGPYLWIASLAVKASCQGQGIGSLLLAGLKEIAHDTGFEGIALACQEELVSYYQMNDFEEIGLSASQLAGVDWVDMYWKCP